jgi:hypothetical protein
MNLTAEVAAAASSNYYSVIICLLWQILVKRKEI